MRKKIQFFLTSITAISLLVFVIISLFWIDHRFLVSARDYLQGNLNTITMLFREEVDDLPSFTEELSHELSNNIRITIMDLEGEVLADSEVDYQSMPNHVDRPEIQEALKSERGEDIRKSELTGIKTLYVAQIWKGQYIMRISIPVAISYEFVLNILPLFFVLMLVILYMVSVLSKKLSQKLVRPFQYIVNETDFAIQNNKTHIDLEHPEDKTLEAMVTQINGILTRMQKHIADVQSKTLEIENIMNSMQEGLLLLDDAGIVIMANKRAYQFMGVVSLQENTNIQSLIREPAFSHWYEQAVKERKNTYFDLKDRDSKIYRFYLSPTDDKGYTLLICDVTIVVQQEKMRSEFTANVSHELKSPLTTVIGYEELLINGMVEEPEQIKEYQKKIYNAAISMRDIINDLLKLSEIEHNVNQDTETVDFNDVFSYAKQMLYEKAEQENISVTIDGQGKLQANKGYMQEVAVNFLDNAIKYNRQNGWVKVKIFTDKDRVGFSVQDSGIGIPPKAYDRIFERFYRVDKGRSRNAGGTGLGLSIVKHIVELYDGIIVVSSNEKGTTFTVKF